MSEDSVPNAAQRLNEAASKGPDAIARALNRETAIRAAYDAGVPRDQLVNYLRAGILLQPKQWLMAAAARECDRPGGPVSIGFGGSRGSGKSHVLISQLAADDCQRFPGLKCLWLRKVGKQNKEHLEDMRRTVLRGVPHDYKSQYGIIDFPNGSKIISGHFQTANEISNYLGVEYDIIAIEEATTLLESKYTDIRTCLRTSKPGWRPRDYSTANPGGVGHNYFKQRFIIPLRCNNQTDTRFVAANCYDNKFNNADYVRILENLPGWRRKAWLEGDWDIMAGQFFTNWREDQNVIPVFNDKDAVHWFAALDYGMAHFTTVILYAINGAGHIVAVEEHYARGAIPSWHVMEVKKMFAKHGITDFSQLRCFVAGSDIFKTESTASSVASTYKNLGMTLTCAEMDRINGWGEIMNRLGDTERGNKPTLLITRQCPRLIEQIPQMQHDPHRPEDVLKVDIDDYGDGGDDFVDNLRMAVASWKAIGAGSVAQILPIGLGKTQKFNSF